MKFYLSLTKPYNNLTTAIADTIKQFYPIGITMDEPGYAEHPGIIKGIQLMEDNIGNDKNYQKRWVSFTDKLAKELGKKIIGTTMGYVPGFSADLILERYEDESLIRVKKLSFAVSLLGPYYSICGVDETSIKDINETISPGCEVPLFYRAINIVTASPYKEFEHDFNFLKSKIEERFVDYQFIPIRVGLTYIKDLHIQWMKEEAQIYNALFNHNFNMYYQAGHLLRGDSYYGFEENNRTVTMKPPPGINNS